MISLSDRLCTTGHCCGIPHQDSFRFEPTHSSLADPLSLRFLYQAWFRADAVSEVTTLEMLKPPQLYNEDCRHPPEVVGDKERRAAARSAKRYAV